MKIQTRIIISFLAYLILLVPVILDMVKDEITIMYLWTVQAILFLVDAYYYNKKRVVSSILNGIVFISIAIYVVYF